MKPRKVSAYRAFGGTPADGMRKQAPRSTISYEQVLHRVLSIRLFFLTLCEKIPTSKEGRSVKDIFVVEVIEELDRIMRRAARLHETQRASFVQHVQQYLFTVFSESSSHGIDIAISEYSNTSVDDLLREYTRSCNPSSLFFGSTHKDKPHGDDVAQPSLGRTTKRSTSGVQSNLKATGHDQAQDAPAERELVASTDPSLEAKPEQAVPAANPVTPKFTYDPEDDLEFCDSSLDDELDDTFLQTGSSSLRSEELSPGAKKFQPYIQSVDLTQMSQTVVARTLQDDDFTPFVRGMPVLKTLEDFEHLMFLAGKPQRVWPTFFCRKIHSTELFHTFTDACQIHDWSEWVTWFVSQFMTADEFGKITTQLARISQQPQESVLDYYRRYSRWCRIAGVETSAYSMTFIRGLLPDLKHCATSRFSHYLNRLDLLVCELENVRLLHMKYGMLDPPYASTSSTSSSSPSSFSSKKKSHQHPKSVVASTSTSSTSSPSKSSSSTSPSSNKSDSKPSASKDSKKSSPSRENDTCHTCGEKGHWSPQCPSKDNKTKSSSKSNPKTPSQTKTQAQVSLVTTSLDSQLPSRFTFDVTINDSTISVVWDSGSQVSICDTCMVNQLGLKLTNDTRTVYDFTGKPHSVRVAEPVTVHVRDCSDVVHSASISLLVSTLGEGVPMLAGLDLLKAWNMSDDQLPKTCLQTTVIDSDLDAGHVSHFVEEGRIPQVQLDSLLAQVKSVIDENKELPISACTFENSHLVLTLTDNTPIFVSQYPIPESQRAAVTKQVQEWLATGVIVKAKHGKRWNFPLLVVSKKSGEARICYDVRKLNQKLVPDNYPLPVISEIFQDLLGFKIISSIDLKSAFTQLAVHPDSQQYLSFTWENERYSFVRCPFGISTIPSHFQKVMDSVLADHSTYCRIYLDDLIIHSSSLEEHVKHITAVVRTLTKYNLRINPEKCHLGYTKISLLGHTLDGESISADPDKISSFSSIPTPTSTQQVKSLLGVASYLGDYIPYMAMITKPLRDMVKKTHSKFVWTTEADQAFQKLKDILAFRLKLHKALPNLDLHVASDASQDGAGAVLFQIDPSTNKTRVISVMSKSFDKAQTLYSANKRELYAVLLALRRFHDWIWGRSFHLYTDHRALTAIFTTPKVSRNLHDWVSEISQYQFKPQYVPGAQMAFPDALSRLFPASALGRGDRFVMPSLVASDSIIPNKVTTTVTVEALDTSSTVATSSQQIGQNPTPALVMAVSSQDDTNVVSLEQPVSLVIKDESPPVLEIQSDSSVIGFKKTLSQFAKSFHEKKIPNESERLQLIQEYHSRAHHGGDKLIEALWHDGYYWDTMRSDCRRICRSCEQCLEFNIYVAGYHPLRPIHAVFPMDHIAIDLAGPIVRSENKKQYIFIAVDIATRFVFLYAMKDKSAASTVMALNRLFAQFGPPKIIQSDNGTEFTNSSVKELLSQHGVDHRRIAAYNPAGNGSAERAVRSVKTVLSKKLEGNLGEWDLWIPSIQFELNSTINPRTKSSPFSLMYGRAPNQFEDYRGCESKLLDAEQLVARHELMNKIVLPTISKVAKEQTDRVAQYVDSRRKLNPEFKPGDPVLVQNVTRTTFAEPRFDSGYTIVKKTEGNAYIVKDRSGEVMTTPIPVQQLKPGVAQPEEPVPESGWDDLAYIRQTRGKGVDREFLVRWKNRKDDSWVSADRLPAGAIARFWQTQQKRYGR